MSNTRLEQDPGMCWPSAPGRSRPRSTRGRTARAIAADRRRRSIANHGGRAVTVLAVVPIGFIATLDGPDRRGAFTEHHCSDPVARPRDRRLAAQRRPAGIPTRSRRRAPISTWPRRAIHRSTASSCSRSVPPTAAVPVGLAHSTPVDTAYDYERVTVYIAGPGVAAASLAASLPADQVASRECSRTPSWAAAPAMTTC
jgi:hypothetical protein